MLKIVEKLLAVGLCPRNAAEGAHSAPPDLLAGGEGVAAPPGNPTPALGARPFGLAPMKYPGHALEKQTRTICRITACYRADLSQIAVIQPVHAEILLFITILFPFNDHLSVIIHEWRSWCS